MSTTPHPLSGLPFNDYMTLKSKLKRHSIIASVPATLVSMFSASYACVANIECLHDPTVPITPVLYVQKTKSSVADSCCY